MMGLHRDWTVVFTQQYQKLALVHNPIQVYVYTCAQFLSYYFLGTVVLASARAYEKNSIYKLLCKWLPIEVL